MCPKRSHSAIAGTPAPGRLRRSNAVSFGIWFPAAERIDDESQHARAVPPAWLAYQSAWCTSTLLKTETSSHQSPFSAAKCGVVRDAAAVCCAVCGHAVHAPHEVDSPARGNAESNKASCPLFPLTEPVDSRHRRQSATVRVCFGTHLMLRRVAAVELSKTRQRGGEGGAYHAVGVRAKSPSKMADRDRQGKPEYSLYVCRL